VASESNPYKNTTPFRRGARLAVLYTATIALVLVILLLGSLWAATHPLHEYFVVFLVIASLLAILILEEVRLLCEWLVEL
jgi:hypothetical protein